MPTGFSSTSSFFTYLDPFLSSFLPPFLFLSSFFFYSSNCCCFLLKRGAFKICSSSSVNYYPFYLFNWIKNFLLDFLAFSALPSSFYYQDFFVYFSRSSCFVSLTKAIESVPKDSITQHILAVSSFSRQA